MSSGDFVEVGMGTQRDEDFELERLRAESADVRRRVSELGRLIEPYGGAAGTERLNGGLFAAA